MPRRRFKKAIIEHCIRSSGHLYKRGHFRDDATGHGADEIAQQSDLSPWRCCSMAIATFWGCGSSRPKGRDSG